jgi:hypothetical protein
LHTLATSSNYYTLAFYLVAVPCDIGRHCDWSLSHILLPTHLPKINKKYKNNQTIKPTKTVQQTKENHGISTQFYHNLTFNFKEKLKS